MKKMILLASVFILGALFFNPANAQEKSDEQNEMTIRLKSGKVKTIKPGQMSPLIIDGKAISPGDVQSITIKRGKGYRLSPRIVQGFKLGDQTYLGVATQKNDKGAEITEVMKESPAEKAGLQKGDIITKVHETAIDGPEALSKTVRDLKPDQKVNISVLRNGKKKDVSAVLGTQMNSITLNTDSLFRGFENFRFKSPNASEIETFMKRFSPRGETIIEGYPFRSARPSLGLQIQETENENGVTVLKVTPDSHAEKAGIKVGDLITAIDGKAIKSVEDITGKITGKEGEEYKLDLVRDNKNMTVTVKIPKRLKKATL